MDGESIKERVVEKELGIVDALSQIGSNAGATLYVVDEKGHLIGSLSDGDVRRWIISTGGIDGKVCDAMNLSVHCVFDNQVDVAQNIIDKYYIDSVPVVDSENCIIDIFESFPRNEIRKKTPSLSDYSVFVMAGGKGKRLNPYTIVLPKPLIPIRGKTILERVLDQFENYHVKEYFLSVNYRKEMIKAYFQEVKHQYPIKYIEENQPLGTAGSLSLLKEKPNNSIFVTNCDILIDAEFEKIMRCHIEQSNSLTIVSSIRNTIIPYGVLHLNRDGSISKVQEKPVFSNLINTGMYVIEPDVIDMIPRGTFYHMTDLISDLLRRNKRVGLYPIGENQYMDMGDFEELSRMEELLRE